MYLLVHVGRIILLRRRREDRLRFRLASKTQMDEMLVKIVAVGYHCRIKMRKEDVWKDKGGDRVIIYSL